MADFILVSGTGTQIEHRERENNNVQPKTKKAMTYIRKNSLFPAFPTFFDDFVTRELSQNPVNHEHTLPKVNVKETKDAFLVEVAAPGYEKSDFKVEIENNLLTLSTEKEWKHDEEKDGRFTRKEYSYSSFQRRFTLPENVVDETKITANYENGILKLELPKREELKPQPKRLIEIA